MQKNHEALDDRHEAATRAATVRTPSLPGRKGQGTAALRPPGQGQTQMTNRP